MIALRAALVLSVLVFMPRLVESFEFPKIAIVRVLGFCAFAGWLASTPWRRRRFSFFEWALLGWLAVEALTTVTSVSPRISLLGDALQHEGLLTSIAVAGLALGARDALADGRALARTIGVALAAAVLACAYALFQVAGYDPLPWSRTASYGAGFVRPFGTLGHPNLLGVVSAAACTWAVALAIRTPDRRWLYAPAVLLTGLATALTLSRAAWLGLAAGLGVVALGTLLDGESRRVSRRSVVVVSGVLVVVVALFWLGGWSRLFTARAGELGSSGGATGASRVEIWKSALAAWRQRPLVGLGPDTFELTFPRYQTPDYWKVEWSGLPFHAHSVYLHTLATRGAAGMLAIVVLAIAVAAAAWRAWWARVHDRGRVTMLGGGLAAIAVAGLAGALGINGELWVFVSAAALDGAARLPDSGRGAAMAAPARRWLATSIAIVVGLVIAWWSYREIAVSRDLAYADHARQTDPAGALAAATHAVALVPTDDRALGALSEAQLALGASRRDPALLAAAQQAAERALASEPLRYAHWQRLGSVFATRALLGDTRALAPMHNAYARAAKLAPVNVLPKLEYARWEIVLGRAAFAIAPAREAVRLYPDESLPRTTLAAALVATGQRDAARAELEIAMKGNWRPQEVDQGSAADVLSKLARGRAPTR
jgi:O-antigen ligase